MNDTKNIDRLFQERFKDFEAKPNEQVWLNIQTALNAKKKERKILPFWIKSSGTAAAFFLGMFSLNTVFKSNETKKNGIVFDTNAIENQHDYKKHTQTKERKTSHPFENKNTPTIVATTPNNQQIASQHEKENTPSVPAKTFNQKKNKDDARFYFAKNHSPLKQATANTNTRINSFSNPKNIIEERYPSKVSETKSDAKTNLKNNTETSIASNALENTDAKQPSVVAENTNELEELLKIKEAKTEKIAYSQKNKWQISPNIGPVYLNSNSSGSAIDPQFAENKKTAENSVSFGIGVNYAVTKKIALRTGINSFSLGYNTNNVVYYAGLNTNNLVNVKYHAPENAIEVQNRPNTVSQLTFEKEIQKTNTGALNQKMGYYEVPLEISYTLLDKKFGISLIGGLSTLFLHENKISLVSSESNRPLGEATNLNPIHFSGNFGLGFRYQFMKSFQVNFEPMVKYQMNTFSNDVGDFKPYFLGLYSGISYRF
jgi:hypothetical protein